MTDDELRALIAAYPVEGDAASMRSGFAALAAAAQPGGADLAGLKRTEETIAGLRVVVLEPERVKGLDIVHLHGGGYVLGSPETHLTLGAQLARAAGARVMLPDYPLAPEHVWPAQREAVTRMLERAPAPFVLSGDSAGGHLALSCALAGARAGALLLFSPNTTRGYGLSRTRGATRDAMNDHETDDRLAAMTFGGVRPADRDQTVLRRDLSTLPRTYLDVGSDEVLLDDALRLSKQAGQAGVHLTLRVRAGFHMLQLFAGIHAGGADSVALAGAWLRAHDAT